MGPALNLPFALALAAAACAQAPSYRYVLETSTRPEAATVREAMLHVGRALAAARRGNGDDRDNEVEDHFSRAASAAPAGAEAVLALAAGETNPALRLPALRALSQMRRLPATERIATLALVLADDPNDLTACFALSLLRRIADRRAAPVVAAITAWAHAHWPQDARELVGQDSLRVLKQWKAEPVAPQVPVLGGCGMISPAPPRVRDDVIALAATLDAGVLARLTAPVRPPNGTLPADAHARFVLRCCADAAWQADAATGRVLLDWLVPQLAGRADPTELAAWDRVAIYVLVVLLDSVPDELLPRFRPLHRDDACTACFSAVPVVTGPPPPSGDTVTARRADRWRRVGMPPAPPARRDAH